MSQRDHAVAVRTVTQLSYLLWNPQLPWYVIIWRSNVWAQHVTECAVAVRKAADLPTAWSDASYNGRTESGGTPRCDRPLQLHTRQEPKSGP